MNLLKKLWHDEAGYVLSAEAALLGTIGVAGATVGLGAAAQAVNDELAEVAHAFRSLDQSYCIEGATGCGACTGASCFTQQDVETSHAELDAWIADHQSEGQEAAASDEDVAPPLPSDEVKNSESTERLDRPGRDQGVRKNKKSDGKPGKTRNKKHGKKHKKKRSKNKKQDKN